MFTRLIASRPQHERSAQGATASLVLHGIALTVAVLATQVKDVIHTSPPERVYPIVAPQPDRPVSPKPRAAPPKAPVAPPVVEQPIVPETPPIVAPTTIPTVIPPAGEATTEPSAPILVGGDPAGETGIGEGTSPFNGALGEFEVDEAAALLPRSPMPRYPEPLRTQRMQGAVRARFVVGTDGRVELSTVQIVEASHPLFGEAVRSILPRMRFKPARAGGRAVRQLVEFPIGFTLQSR